jgi:hypothetical protein
MKCFAVRYAWVGPNKSLERSLGPVPNRFEQIEELCVLANAASPLLVIFRLKVEETHGQDVMIVKCLLFSFRIFLIF